jgi:hypothetical protein
MKISYLVVVITLLTSSCEEKLPPDIIDCRGYPGPFRWQFPYYEILLDKKDDSGANYFVSQKIDTAAIFIQRIGKNGQLENKRKTKSIIYGDNILISFELKREDCIDRDLNFKELISYPNGAKDTVAVFYKSETQMYSSKFCIIRCPKKSKYGIGYDLAINGKMVFLSTDEWDHIVPSRVISF